MGWPFLALFNDMVESLEHSLKPLFNEWGLRDTYYGSAGKSLPYWTARSGSAETGFSDVFSANVGLPIGRRDLKGPFDHILISERVAVV